MLTSIVWFSPGFEITTSFSAYWRKSISPVYIHLQKCALVNTVIAAHKTCQFVQLICLYCGSKKAHAADIDAQQGLMKTDAAPCGIKCAVSAYGDDRIGNLKRRRSPLKETCRPAKGSGGICGKDDPRALRTIHPLPQPR